MLSDSKRVILPMRTRFERPDRLPSLSGVLVAQAKASGHCVHSFIELDTPGIPRPFRGERWCYDWRSDGDNVLACWLGFPNVFFSAGIDPNLRISVEALGRFGTDKGPLSSLARINISVKPAGETGPAPDDAAWMPENGPRAFPLA